MADIEGTNRGDYIEGESENDYISARRGRDYVDGDLVDWFEGDGDDFYDIYGYDDEIFGSSGRDTLIGENSLYVSGYAYMSGGSDYISGGTGRDRIVGDGELYTYDGYTIEFYGGSDDLEGGRGDDTIIGDGSISSDEGFGSYYAEAGEDYITGGSGDDIMYGDFEYLSGEADDEDDLEGEDTFFFAAGDEGSTDFDTIMDFDANDTFEIEGLEWEDLDSNGNDELDDRDRAVDADGDLFFIDLGRAGGEDRDEDVIAVYTTESVDQTLGSEYFEFV